MQTVRQWLEARGLGQYAAVFESNDVDLDILPTLEDEDLVRLGISLGHRKKILRALREPHGMSNDADAVPTGDARASSMESLTAQGERRQVTVLFCDLVGSTALSNTHDPEEYRAILSRYHETCIRAIQRYDGFVAQIQGDGVVAYFGYPLAHEGEAERAVRAGLSVVERLAQLEDGLAEVLRVRIGAASGLVVVSHVLAPDKSAVGETPNMAARLQTLAQPGELMVSERTKVLAGGAFDYEDRGVHELKGIAEPARAWKVLGPSDVQSRFEAATRGRLTPIVGRDQEIGLLLDRWELSRAGEGQVVLLQGAPGIGKSRLLRAFRERLDSRIEVALSYQCSPYYTNSAFYPIADHLERALGFERNDSAEQKLDKLERYLVGQFARTTTDCSLLARMLSIPCEARYGVLEISPQRQKEDTIALLVNLVAALARQQATVMLFEDVHWADPTSIEVLSGLIDQLEKLPLLVLITYRPEFQPPWLSRPQVTPIALTRLSRAQGANIVLRVADNKPLPAALVTQIVDKTDGVPLFLEELTKAVLESDMLVDLGDRYDYSGKVEQLAIPNTLRDSLMARLDRLIPVKEIAQIGAVLGRQFSFELVQAVSPMTESQLGEALDKLTASELVFRRGTPPNATYIFKHALVQDAAYDSLLKSKRQALHAQIAEAIRERLPNKAETEPELLAHHYTEAGLYERAVPLWVAAGQRALARVALPEAVSHLTTALQVNDRLPLSTDRDRQELDIRVRLGIAHQFHGGWAADQVARALEPARALATQLNDHSKLVPTVYHLWIYHTTHCQFPQAFQDIADVEALAQKTGHWLPALVAPWIESMTRCYTGEFQLARAAMRHVLQAYNQPEHAPLAAIYNHDPKCGTLLFASYFLWALGYPDQAKDAALEQADLARQVGHAFNLCWCLLGGAFALLLRGEAKVALQWAAEADAIAREQAMTYVAEFIVPWWRGQALIEHGDYEAGYAQVTLGADRWRAGGGVLMLPFSDLMRGKALTALQRFAEAETTLVRALELTEQTGHRMYEADIHRVIGRLHENRPAADLSLAQACYLKAIDVARCQDAKGFELRSALSLARLWQAQHKRREAYDLLAPLYDWFTEGHDTRDLREAAALLNELK